MNWEISYYNDSVLYDVHQLEKDVKAKFLAITDNMLVHGPNLGMPFTKAMGKGLFEIRAKSYSGIARGFFCTISKKSIIILHVFVKKTTVTPPKELEIAKRRMKEVKEYDLQTS